MLSLQKKKFSDSQNFYVWKKLSNTGGNVPLRNVLKIKRDRKTEVQYLEYPIKD